MSELPSISDIFSDDATEQREITGKMDKAIFISVPEWACCVTTVAAERLILGLVWKFGKPSKNKRPMGFCAKSKWIEDHYRLSKNTISRAYTSLKDKGYIQKVGDGSWMLNYAAIYRAAIENGCKMKQGRTETVPGQLASGQTLRFDPFSCLYLKYSHNHSRHL